jgi:hypothetical protein
MPGDMLPSLSSRTPEPVAPTQHLRRWLARREHGGGTVTPRCRCVLSFWYTVNKLPHAPWFQVHYRTASREGLSTCRQCGQRTTGVFDCVSELLTITLTHMQRCNPAAVVGLVTIDGEQRAAAIMGNPSRMVIPASQERPWGTVYGRVRPIVPAR